MKGGDANGVALECFDARRARIHGGADPRRRRLVGTRYRWAVLAAGTLAQASFPAITVGLAVIAPGSAPS
jgi:hypothetical protein